MNEMIEELTHILRTSNNIVFFGGAGVSTESGIPDFRSNKGIYRTESGGEYKPEQILSHSFYKRHTKEFYEFYRKNMIYPDAKPNKAHYALAKLEEQGKLRAVITQNIDGLHQMAGSKHVLELHGCVHRNNCTQCEREFDLNFILKADEIPKCPVCGGIIKPDVVLYEESLDDQIINEALLNISKAEVIIVGGTSLVVQPAASFLRYFQGEKMILINKGITTYDSYADIVIRDSLGEVLDRVVN